MSWQPTTDDEFSQGIANTADSVYDAMQDFGAGQSEVSGYAKEDDEHKSFSVVVAEGPADTVGIYIDWTSQEVITAWRVSE